jgi:branched-chain amino acid transport system ATP-binding protein
MMVVIMPGPILMVDNLTASYGSLVAVRNVSIAFEARSRTGIFGHNGSGKSTLLKCLVGGLKAMSGSVRFNGIEIQPQLVHRNVRLGIGLVPQSRNVFPSLTVESCLRIAGLRENNTDFDTVFQIFPVLSERRRQRAGSMSGGEQQMLAVGMALMTRPNVLILDEPTAGLSPVAAKITLESIRTINQRFGTTIILVEQNVLTALEVVERAIVLRSGQIVFDGHSNELQKKEDLWSWF